MADGLRVLAPGVAFPLRAKDAHGAYVHATHSATKLAMRLATEPRATLGQIAFDLRLSLLASGKDSSGGAG